MKDKLGKELNIGDTVVFNLYKQICVGTIVSIGKNKVKIKHEEVYYPKPPWYKTETVKEFQNVVKLVE